MNERIKAARKALGLTMEQFGKRVGLSKSAISLIESGKNGTTEQTVASICREFGVNEMWLRTGEGEMFDQSAESSLDRLAAEYHLDERKKAVISAFLKLSTADQEAILRYVDSLAAELAVSPPALDIDAEVESYRQELLAQKKVEATASLSAGTAADAG